MRNLFGLLFMLFIGFQSCDGRKTKHQALLESIETFKNTVNLQVDTYKPETYTEREVDTLLSNGFHINIKTSSDMHQSVLFTHIKDTINYNTHYRDMKFDISVSKDNKLIYTASFDKQSINKTFNFNTDLKSSSNLYNFDKLAILKSIEVDADPTDTNRVAIAILYAIPESDRSASYILYIDKNGTSNIVRYQVN